MTMSWQLIRASELVRAAEGQAWANNPPWMNVTFQKGPIGAHDLKGPGIYAFFLDCQLLYIGIYAGRKNEVFGGSVLDDRWLKHVGVITLRGKKISLRQQTLAQLKGNATNGAVEPILAAGENLLRSQGMEASFRKIKFLTDHWVPLNLGAPIKDMLARLSIGYLQMPPGGKSGAASKTVVKAFLEAVETALVVALSPPLNTRSIHARFGGNGPDEVMPMIRARLLTSLSEVPHLGQSDVDLAEAQTLPITSPADESPEPSEVFDERLPATATALVAELTKRVEVVGDLMLYYTHNGRQIRLARPVELGAKRRPLLVMEWQPRKESFLCNCRLANSALPRRLQGTETSDKAMECKFHIPPDLSYIPDLLAVCC